MASRGFRGLGWSPVVPATKERRDETGGVIHFSDDVVVSEIKHGAPPFLGKVVVNST